MGEPDWREIRRLADQLSAATPLLRESLIEADFDKGPLIPAKDDCQSICLELNKVLGLPLGDVDVDVATTVNNAMEVALELKGNLVTLISITDSLADEPSVGDRVELQKNWHKLSRETIRLSPSAAEMLRSLVAIIDLQAPGSGSSSDADTAS